MSGEGYTLGTCRYCGQVVSLERERPTQEAADIAASEECSCYDAREERAICRKIENAQDRIQKVFGSEAEELGFRPINAPEPIQLMNDIAVLIARGYITSAVVNVRGQCRAKISLTSKEKIKVERSETRSYQLVKLGDRRTVHPATLDGHEKGKPRPLTGTVVYIHPAGRYCVLEFEVGTRGERIRESFQLIEGEIAE